MRLLLPRASAHYERACGDAQGGERVAEVGLRQRIAFGHADKKLGFADMWAIFR